MATRPAIWIWLISALRSTSCRPNSARVILIGAEGFSYEDAALMCGCAIGTMKSASTAPATGWRS